MSRPDRILLLAGAALMAGCGTEAPPAYTARDSAGVRIVESVTPRWSAGAGWAVDTVASLSIGTMGGAPELSFSGVSGVRRLPDGSIVVADGTARDLRIFDRGGGFVKRFGRVGPGPGEFQQIQSVGVTGDTVWVFDPRAQRLTFLDPATGGYRMAPVVLTTGGSTSLTGRRADGGFVFGGDVLFKDGAPPPTGFYRPPALYVRVAPDGALDTLLWAKGREMIIPAVEPDRAVPLIRPMFNRASSAAVRGDELLYGDQETYEVRSFDSDGRLLAVLRRVGVDLSLSEGAYAAERDRLIGAAPEEVQPGLRAAYAAQPTPTSRPAFGRFVVDADQNLWVQDYSNDGSATHWSVFDPDGVWLGVVTLPARFRPNAIGRDEVLGVWRDDLDVEYVRAYPLRRGSAG